MKIFQLFFQFWWEIYINVIDIYVNQTYLSPILKGIEKIGRVERQ